jgi:hypothetical protein
MYSLLEEAWPDFQPNRNAIEKFSSETSMMDSSAKRFVSADEYEQFISFKQNELSQRKRPSIEPLNNQTMMHSHQNQKDTGCHQILEHIHRCDYCMKEIYKRYNCNRSDLPIDISQYITPENKDVITVVLIGLLIILVIQLFTPLQTKSK